MAAFGETVRHVSQVLALKAGPALRAAADFVFPPQCLKCRTLVAEPGTLCADCWGAIRFIAPPFCRCCGQPMSGEAAIGLVCGACLARPPAFEAARSVFLYDDASKPLVLSFKHGDRLDCAPAFGRWLKRAAADLLPQADLIVPIPLHWRRLFRRRYNQAAVLALALSRETGLPADTRALIRGRATPSQGEMRSARQRRINVSGAFAVPERARRTVKGRKILLVDDVFTTGATLNAAARALKRAGVQEIFAVTLAHVVR